LSTPLLRLGESLLVDYMTQKPRSASASRREDGMFRGRMGRGLRIAAVVGIFGAGYLCGTLGQRSACAQTEPKQGGGSFGAFGQLERSIVEMQKHVDGLNQELETLRKIRSALGL
jgi:hypothetical protein